MGGSTEEVDDAKGIAADERETNEGEGDGCQRKGGS